jgi:hypothetical protein
MKDSEGYVIYVWNICKIFSKELFESNERKPIWYLGKNQ